MTEACYSRARARDAWNSGNLAETQRLDDIARHVELARWDRGECCGFKCGAKIKVGMRNCYSGFIQAKRLHLMRAWGIPDHIIETLQPNCEHDHGNAEMLRAVLLSDETEENLRRVFLRRIFGWDDGKFINYREELANVASELINVEQAETQITKLRTKLDSVQGDLQRALIAGQIIKAAQVFVKHHISDFAALAGSPAAFVTDKDSQGGYTNEQLIAPITEAILRGIPLVGNCFNIIAGRMYVTIAGYENLLANSAVSGGWLPPTIQLGQVEVVSEAGWVDLPKERWTVRNGKEIKSRAVTGVSKVEAIGTMRRGGQVIEVEYRDRTADGGIDGRIVIRTNYGQGEDSTISKARRKVLRALYAQVSGMGVDDDPDEAGVIEVEATPHQSGPAITVQTSAPTPTDKQPTPTDKLLAAFADLGVTRGQIEGWMAASVEDFGPSDIELLREKYKLMQQGKTWTEATQV
jgi:hypothetical protein